ncbi:excinuclease ABC subunit C [Lederbergia citrea]|uniref:Excinuclease ABC subunit C n=1 Tax=Lederbergia citrea TaxID=2833581 RepID=A0A942Z6B5_9BACI|nr:excinuclease ABC subunit C [Lederbergia citrea]MBS4223846.1 excinuclease ABC subunit C [Lederbergia citrea]
MKSISDVKGIVNQLIEEHSDREITSETKYNTSGIYMIYIDHLTSDKIVPIYIGQSKDVQKRYKDHLSEILALNRFSYNEYYNYFFYKSNSFYEGHFKSSKIFKFMIENNCTLSDFRMILLEEVEVGELEKKEQEYIKRLNASFFGFNQLNSLLAAFKLRREGGQLSELEDFLRLVQVDIKGIYSYYDYGFTRFNFEHSFPKNFTFLLELNDKLSDTKLFKEVKSAVDQLIRRYQLHHEMTEIRKLEEKWSILHKYYLEANDEYHQAFTILGERLRAKFKELRFYSDNAFKNFLSSIVKEEKEKHRKEFLKYLVSKQCDLNFYKLFSHQIAVVNEKLDEKNNREKTRDEAYKLLQEKRVEYKHERYKMIFPSTKYSPFSLGDRAWHFPLKIEEGMNACYIQLFISNNGRTRGEYRKDPFIVRFDYCYLDGQGRRFEKQYYIENETTKNSASGIEYIEKDFYRSFVFNPERFSITGVIENEIENSFISVLAEFRHGINDYTIKDKDLVRLEEVLDELQQLVDDETVFYLSNTESNGCLEKSLVNEGFQNHPFAEKLLKIGNRRKSSKSKPNKEPKKSKKAEKVTVKVNPKIKRAEAFREKVLARSNYTIDIINYVSSKEKVTAECKDCGHTWKIRGDHLMARLSCPECRKK